MKQSGPLQVDAVVNTQTRIDNTSPPEQEHLTQGKRLSAVDRGVLMGAALAL